MRLVQIQTGTPLTIYAGDERDIVLRARFIDNMSDSVFYVYSQDIMSSIDSYIGKTVSIEIAVMDNLLKAECRVRGKGGRKQNYDSVMLESLTELKSESRRDYDRYDVQIITNIYSYKDVPSADYKGDFICESISADISKGGMRVIANKKLNETEEARFTLEFSVTPGSLFSLFSIPSTIVRTGRSASAFSGYDYGFRFDFSKIPDTQEKLINDLFKLKLTEALR